MQKIIYLTILWFCNIFLFGQSEEKKIKSITTPVDKINKDTAEYATKVYSNHNELKDLQGFYKNGQLRKIIYKRDLIQGYYLTEYYFLENKLIYVYEKQDIWDPLKGGSPKATPLDSLFKRVKNTYEGSFYFFDKQMLDKTIKDDRVFKSGAIIDNENKEKFILDSAKECMEELNSIK